MSRVIHFDCSSGVSSDMLLGALIHLGADAGKVASSLRGLGLAEFRLRVEAVERRSITGCAAGVEIIGGDGGHQHRHTSYRDIADLIGRAPIGVSAKGWALAAYSALASAEAAAHGVAVGDVHFHEVGSPRAVCTVTGVAIAAELLGAEAFTCGVLTDGSGTVECSHGTIPVPVPAVRELLKQTDIPLNSDAGIETELVTPSGLAALIGLGCRHAGGPPPSRTLVTGYGFGTRDTGLLGAVVATLAPKCGN